MMPAVPTWLTFVQFIKKTTEDTRIPVHHVNTQPIYYSSVKPPMYISTCPKGFSRRSGLIESCQPCDETTVDYVNEDIKRVHGNNTPSKAS
jgi:hypothetical protein